MTASAKISIKSRGKSVQLVAKSCNTPRTPSQTQIVLDTNLSEKVTDFLKTFSNVFVLLSKGSHDLDDFRDKSS